MLSKYTIGIIIKNTKEDIYMYEFIEYLVIFQVVMDIYDLLIGSALIYGALKWRKGLLSTTACYWGIILGLLGGGFIAYMLDMPVIIVITGVIGAIVFPIMTYQIPAVNRFVLGFIVTLKLLYMLTTYLCKEGVMEFSIAVILPLIIATLLGIIFMFMRKISVLPFALGCVFIGASQLAPTIAKYINQFIFGITQDYSLLFDPVDFIFALFKIELTDGWTLLLMLIFMGCGLPIQFSYIKKQGYSYDTPLIVFETENADMHGKIIS